MLCLRAQRGKHLERGITMSVDKVGKGQREELSERELEAVSGGEEFFVKPVDPKKCLTCGEPLSFSPTGFRCNKCGYELKIEFVDGGGAGQGYA